MFGFVVIIKASLSNYASLEFDDRGIVHLSSGCKKSVMRYLILLFVVCLLYANKTNQTISFNSIYSNNVSSCVDWYEHVYYFLKFLIK